MLLKPLIQLNRITDITVELLNNLKIEALILDVDNTLAIDKGKILLSGVEDWIKTVSLAGIKLIILSNSKPKRMAAFAKKINLPFVALGLKPLPIGYLRAAKRLNVNIKKTAIVGDQLFTDILGGNLSGCKTVLVSPIKLESSKGFKIKRALERKVLKYFNLKCDF